ncbi:hypothetical protein ACK3SF_02780 [Candidatus Nanosalina sp. VS9-1]|uniref:hypothetical protein n=1 Tax=Candidatus Nanosalina sp. VS9-1 TaxID=3388566 RepID=UPI0039DFD877
MDLPEKLNEVKGVKNVKNRDSGLRINLFTEPVGTDAEKIRGDLRSISQRIRKKLEQARENGEINGWDWKIKPKKRYTETGLGNTVKDRKEKGYSPAYYVVSIR